MAVCQGGDLSLKQKQIDSFISVEDHGVGKQEGGEPTTLIS